MGRPGDEVIEDDERIDREDPGRRGDDRIEVDLDELRMVDPEARDRRDQLGDRGAIDGRPAAHAIEQAGTAEAGQHLEGDGRGHRRETDRDVVKDLGEDPAEADDDGGPERGVAAEPDEQLQARVGHGLDQQAADVERVRRPQRQQRLGRGMDRGVADEVRAATAPMSLLCARSPASSLRATACPPSGRAAATAASASGTAMAGVTAIPAARSIEALALGQRRGRTASRSRPRDRSVGDRAVRAPIGRERRPRRPPRPAVARASCRASQRATEAIALNASTAPRRSGAPSPCSSSIAFVSGVRLARGQRDVDRQDARAVAGRVSSGHVTSCAVATSAGIERYGKSWTSTSTS